MKEAYIGTPSLTEAQRAAELLRRERIGCTVVRMPALPGKSGCAFGLRLGENALQTALERLKNQGIRMGRVLLRGSDGTFREYWP